MSYEVLARKWRPRSFAELVGQEHVRRALANALDRGQLHHAYLFTGTRGVGKTTIARILAKSLNCETHGVSSEPCGECGACREVDDGRFIDLIEVDAASRTRVDETRELLENVPYAPTRGRYKVYLIDEVHMFSGHSFNALLKTLEEPPPHVKFLLATTDPQKVPVTVLSRCLQFNLKLMPLAAINEHLVHIASAEGVEHDEVALGHIARAASGSMRDALSLLDQAIAYGQGAVHAREVESMLGTPSRERLLRLADALAAADGAALLAEVEGLAQAAADLEPVLIDLQSLLHQIAIAQAVPEAVDPAVADIERIHALAERLEPAAVQLYHQIATLGRRDMAWAPDPRAGLEMTLLRMLAFRPAGGEMDGAQGGASAGAGADGAASPSESRRTPDAGPGPERAPAEPPQRPASEAVPPAKAAPARSKAAEVDSGEETTAATEDLDWPRVVAALNLRGLAGELAANSVLLAVEGRQVRLGLAAEHAHLGGERYRSRLEGALAEYLGHEVKLQLIEEVPAGLVTPAELEQQVTEERLRTAEAELRSDPVVQALEERFGATVEPGSVSPGEGNGQR